MDENEITQRLRDAGRQPVPGEVRASHLSQMHTAAPVVERQKRFGRLAVAAAAFVGFAVGSTGFAMAGALPGPAQGVAHDVLSVVQVQVPDRPDNRGGCISNAARTLDGEAEKQAKRDCKARITPGRPDGVGKGNGKGRPDGAGPPVALDSDDDPCTGPPPWAGKGANEDKAAQKQQHRAAREAAGCRSALDDDNAEAEAEALEEQQERGAEALEEQRQAEGEQKGPPAEKGPDERVPADPGAAGDDRPDGGPESTGQGDAPAEVPTPAAPSPGAAGAPAG